VERSEKETGPVIWNIVIEPEALEMIGEITDRRIKKNIVKNIDGLNIEPDKQGYSLSDELAGHRAKRAVGQRYRIIYRCDLHKLQVSIVGVGIRRQGSRKDVYFQVAKILGK
jgi:mRNA interferase RelE/StbE